MTRLLVRRALELAITLIGIWTVLFFVIRLSGDPIALLMGPNASAEQIEAMRADLGLDRPLATQYLLELKRMATLDFGRSIRGGQRALDLACSRLAISLQLTASAMLLAVALAIPVGIAAAAWRERRWTRWLLGLTFLGQALPIFWTGPMLILLFAVTWQLLPVAGWQSLAHGVLPVITLASVLLAKLARMVRAEMLEVLGQDYIRTARSKGLPQNTILMVHGARNAMIPVITVMGTEFGQLVGAAVLTESIFAIPGLGDMLLNAALARDYPVVQAGVFVITLVVVGVNAMVDIAYTLIDPRVRHAIDA
ncbi:MAG: ABC transporter permease [Gammaproteobacteria bacterium]|nr:ABC transporter permease [Gammaproteobacteria bacterium]